jgi:hypothetical protein
MPAVAVCRYGGAAFRPQRGEEASLGIPSNKTDDLHAVWDTVVLRRAGLTTIADAHALNAEITQAEATQWATFTIADWATESEALARRTSHRRSTW